MRIPVYLSFLKGDLQKIRPDLLDQLSPPRRLTAPEMINILLKMGYELRKIDRGACG
jgi:hypothetical protein